jgi:bifunctional DNase/RNase
MRTLIQLITFMIFGIFIGASISDIMRTEGNLVADYYDYSHISSLSPEGFSEVDIETQPGFIYLIKNCTAIVMVTNVLQTDSINNGIEKNLDFRPNTHDTIKNIFETFNMTVPMVKIDSFKEDTYFARLFVRQRDKILNLDVRPSDAIAIGVRMESPIYVSDSVIESNGRMIC